MKTRLLLLPLLTFVLLAAGCSKDDSGDTPQPDIEVTDVTEISYDEFLKQCIQNYHIDLSDPEMAADFKFTQDVIAERAKRFRQESDGDLFGICKLSVKYNSKLPNGSPAVLSGAIFMDATNYYAHKQQNGIIMANHYTICADRDSPSYQFCFPWETLLCARNFVVVMTDYVGFGTTVGMPQAYLHAESTAQAVVDLFLQTRSLLAEHRFYNIGDVNYNVGYSQGAHAAIAVHKLVQEKYSDKIKLKKTVAGGGPYDIEAVYNECITTNKTGIPPAIPLIIIGMNFAENLNLDLPSLFKSPLKTNYTDWLVSKKFRTEEIAKMMGGYGMPVSNILEPIAFDPKNPQTQKLVAAFRKNSLVQGWKPAKGGAQIHLFHSTEDDVVPVICARRLVDFIVAETGEYPGMEISTYGGHERAGKSFFARVMLEQIPL